MRDRQIPVEHRDAATDGVRRDGIRLARVVIATFRGRLDWILAIADWEGLFNAGVEALDLPGRRQGVSQRAALLALPLEHKHALIQWALAHLRSHLRSSVGQQICVVCDLERFPLQDLDAMLTQRQWADLRRRLAGRLRTEYRKYKDAQSLLFTEHARLVGLIVAKVVFNRGQHADCAQEGAVALLHAIDRVDTSASSLTAYCATWITRHIRNYLMRETLPVHVPVNVFSLAVRDTARTGLDIEGGTDAPEVSSSSDVVRWLTQGTVSIDASGEPFAPELDRAMVDAPDCSPAAHAAAADDLRMIRSVCATLTGKQRVVVESRFGLSGGPMLTLAEVAAHEGISQQQVSMREKRALLRLREALCGRLGA